MYTTQWQCQNFYNQKPAEKKSGWNGGLNVAWQEQSFYLNNVLYVDFKGIIYNL